jgi:radical SAM superfamily enzyme YgiQ (UPF0313 family)
MVDSHAALEQSFREIESIVTEHGSPELIGFSAMVDFAETRALAVMCKQAWPDCTTVVGNNFATLNCEALLRLCPELDYAIVGDGETTFTELASRLLNGASVEDSPGLGSWKESGYHVNPADYPELDGLPWVSRTELSRILGMGMSPSIFTKRGCPYRCSFCGTGAVSQLTGRATYRYRSVDSVVEEIAMLTRDYEIPHLTIVDDLFVSQAHKSREWAVEFANKLIANQNTCPLMLDVRTDSIDRSTFRLLYKAGLRTVFIGLESGSESVLRQVFGKRTSLHDDASAKLAILHDIGIEVVPGMILFHPETTIDDLALGLNTIDMAGHKNPGLFCYPYHAYPGTPLYNDYVGKGYISSWPSTEWSFVDPNAKLMFERVRARLKSGGDADFDVARAAFVDELASWRAFSPPYQRQPTAVLQTPDPQQVLSAERLVTGRLRRAGTSTEPAR